jgi:hypothetical protein
MMRPPIFTNEDGGLHDKAPKNSAVVERVRAWGMRADEISIAAMRFPEPLRASLCRDGAGYEE